jgi:hypothetical protein
VADRHAVDQIDEVVCGEQRRTHQSVAYVQRLEVLCPGLAINAPYPGNDVLSSMRNGHVGNAIRENDIGCCVNTVGFIQWKQVHPSVET